MSDSIKPIGMSEMSLIFEVTDDLGISREDIEVPLMPRGEGGVSRLATGKFEIIIPADQSLADWLPELRKKLVELSA